MVEIRYGEQYEAANLAGMSVAETRERYESEFDIPELAKAYLNGKEIGKDLEPKMLLSNDDRLSFEAKRSRKGRMLVGALLVALAITIALFAYSWTTDSVTIGATAHSTFTTVEPTSLLATAFGGFGGKVPTGSLFEITPDSDYTGYLLVKVYLTNVEELMLAYRHLNLELQLHDKDGNNLHAIETGYTSEILSLDNEVALFFLSHPSGAGSPYKIYLAEGFIASLRNPLDSSTDYEVTPLLSCEVIQR